MELKRLRTLYVAAAVPSGNLVVLVKMARQCSESNARVTAALTDSAIRLSDLYNHVLAFVPDRDWEQIHSHKDLSMALAAETGELMEHFLWATGDQSRTIVNGPAKQARIADELADVVIYALEFANTTGLDVAAAIEAKMAANAKKYPVEKARGRSDKYTEL